MNIQSRRSISRTQALCVGTCRDQSQRPSRLLDDSVKTGVWPDSVQVLGGTPASRLPTCSWVWLYSGLRPVEHRGVVWLKRDVPGSQ